MRTKCYSDCILIYGENRQEEPCRYLKQNFLTSGPAPRTTTSDCNDFQSQTGEVKSESEDAREGKKRGIQKEKKKKKVDRFRDQTFEK